MNILKLEEVNKLLRFCTRVWVSLDKFVRRTVLKKIRYSGIANLLIDDLGFKMYSKYDDGIVDALYFNNTGYSEIKEVRLFKELAKQSRVILDIGANTGLYSIISRKINPDAKIYAFEPYIINLNRLKKNLLLNKIQDVVIVEKALGNAEREIEFAVPSKDQICDVLSADLEFSNTFYRKWVDYKAVKVPQTTLDTFLSRENISRLDLIKIDVENYETFVLQGALKLLARFSPIILVEIFVDQDKINFYEKHLMPLGYNCYSILKEGIIRTSSLIENSDCRNFILTKGVSQKEYLSFKNLDELILELKLFPEKT